jgi:hypothetical protein
MDDLVKKEIIDKYHRIFRRRPMPLCNDCFTSKNVIPCVYGIPSKELGTYAKGTLSINQLTIIEIFFLF